MTQIIKLVWMMSIQLLLKSIQLKFLFRKGLERSAVCGVRTEFIHLHGAALYNVYFYFQNCHVLSGITLLGTNYELLRFLGTNQLDILWFLLKHVYKYFPWIIIFKNTVVFLIVFDDKIYLAQISTMFKCIRW